MGSKNFPEFPARSLAESYYNLKKSLGIHSSSFHSISIRNYQYSFDQFIIGVDTEKILEASFTGVNCRSGDLMTLRGKYSNSNTLDAWASCVYIILNSDNSLEIRDTGCQVFD